MVTINQKQTIVNKDGEVTPVMQVHLLTLKKDSGPWKQGNSFRAYIAQYSADQFAVWNAH